MNVQFHLEFNGTKPVITNISIHGRGKDKLPTHPEIRTLNGESAFYIEFDAYDNDRVVRRYQYFNDEFSKALIERIYKIAEEQIPKFGK